MGTILCAEGGSVMTNSQASSAFRKLANAVRVEVKRSHGLPDPYREQDDTIRIDTVRACVTTLEPYSDGDLARLMSSAEYDLHVPVTIQTEDDTEDDFADCREAVGMAVYEYLCWVRQHRGVSEF